MKAVKLLIIFFGALFTTAISYANNKLILNGYTATQQPSIIAQSTSFTAIAGTTKTLSITPIGTAPLSTQWFKNGTAVTSANAATTYTTPVLLQSDTGAIFTAKVTNAFGSATSQPIQTTVNTDITINVHPQTQTVTSPTSAMFTVAATGSATLSCQWYKNGVLITGATSCTNYKTPATVVTDSGSAFTVVFTDAYSSLSSNAGVLTILPPANISFVASAFSFNNGTPPQSCVVNVPTGTQANDMEILWFATGITTVGLPTGFSPITTIINTGNIGYQSYFYYHVATGSEPASYTITNLVYPECEISTYRNAGLSTPVDATQTAMVASGTSATIPALTATLGPSEQYIACYDYNVNGTNLITGPAALTRRFSDGTAISAWCGDMPINAQGTIPAAQTATGAVANQWNAMGFTLQSATGTTSNFSVTSPVSGQALAGIITAQGTTGSQWVNVYATDVNGTKVSLADNTPSGGRWTLQIDTSKLVSAPGTCPGTISTCPVINFIASSVPSGQSGGTKATITVPVNANNTNSALFTVSSPTAGATIGGTAAPANGTCGTQWTAIQAFYNASAISSAVSCASGAWSLTMNTTLVPSGAATVTFQASANGFQPASINVSVNVAQSSAYDQYGLPNTPTHANIAVPAEAWLQSIGVYLWSGGGAEGGTSNSANLIQYMGARSGRGSGGPTKDAGNDSYFRTIATTINNANPNYHFKYVYMLFQGGCYGDSDFVGGNSPPTGNELYNIVQLYQLGLLHHIEVGNEPANDYVCWNGVTYGGGYSARQGSYNGLALMQASVHTALQTNSTIAGKVALSTSNYIGAQWDNAGLSWGLAMPNPQPSGLSQNSPGPSPAGTVWADYLSVHNYAPASTGWRANNVWDSTRRRTPSGAESFYEDFCQGNFPLPCNSTNQAIQAQKPGLSTEGGVWGATFDSNNPCNIISDSHAQQNVYAIDQYIEGFTGCGDATGGSASCDKGMASQTWYNLVDGDGGYCNANGLFQGPNGPVGDVPFNPWPAAITMHNATTILNDVGTNFTPGTVNWTISGCPLGGNANQSNCHGLLLQKTNGHFWLLQTYDWDGGTTANVTINFGQTFANVNVYDPTVGTGIQASAPGTSSYSYTNNNGAPKFFELW